MKLSLTLGCQLLAIKKRDLLFDEHFRKLILEIQTTRVVSIVVNPEVVQSTLGKRQTFCEKNSHYRYNPSVSILLISWKASEPCSYDYIVSNFDSINGVPQQFDSKSQQRIRVLFLHKLSWNRSELCKNLQNYKHGYTTRSQSGDHNFRKTRLRNWNNSSSERILRTVSWMTLKIIQ